ncbi:hypothetical protein TELCIR_18101 [Teladorsagia circumcincta]|uniref:SKI/SNO/DAC domain-containing protein n=1 Tax=Teladorsagia circumcincta TaxID=45464 RepID=A0A2G9TQY8_TELCI|nr:hypothetical protein TELCIR_18101 [Teladorsagia circumcincta]
MVLGGEPRVPIHLLLSRVLFTQGVSEIQAMMDDLNIHKSIATNEQAERLRKMDAEVSATQDLSNLNLVTRSDAERICGIVRIESTPSTHEPIGLAPVGECSRPRPGTFPTLGPDRDVLLLREKGVLQGYDEKEMLPN